MNIKEKVAYIKGLAEGAELDASTKEGKILTALIDLVSDMADSIEELEEDVDTALDYCEELDEDLGAVEEILVDDEDCDCDCCDDDDDFECNGDCEDCDEDCELADEDYFEVECPACGEVICFDGSIDPEELACPACGEKFECVISEEDLENTDAE
ncbi:MAG: hypothetical protein IJ011_10500 [Clostridia bacterium]|nr:hypothetical protein [Clostridia bacterium]MBQ8850751.1 hypothetical protein [Clostridia bacterium]